MTNSLTFGKKPSKSENIVLLIILFFLLLLFTTPFAWVALESKSYSVAAMFVGVAIFFALMAWKVYSTLRVFFPVELSGKFAVFIRPIARRVVYDMTRINDIRLAWVYLFFRYEGWPIIIPLRMEKKERLELVDAIEHARKNYSPVSSETQ